MLHQNELRPFNTPNDILLLIFSHLIPENLASIRRVNSLFNKLAKSDALWKQKYQTHFYHIAPMQTDWYANFSKTYREQYINQLQLRNKKIFSIVKEGDLDSIQSIIKSFHDLGILEYHDVNNDTLLYWANINHHQLLLKHFYLIAVKNCSTLSFKKKDLLYWAVVCNQSSITISTLLLDRYDINKVYYEGCDKHCGTLLYFAAYHGQLPLVNFLLGKGANIDIVANQYGTPLHVAAKKGHLEVVTALLAKGAQINTVMTCDGNPLHVASANGHIEIVKILLDKGANINATTTSHKYTPLHLAVKMNRIKMVSLLLDKGANINAVSSNGMTPLHFAAELQTSDVLNVLLSKNANIDAQTTNSETPIFIAAKYGRIEAIKSLLEKGANINLTDVNGNTPLAIAIKNKDKNSINILNRHDIINYIDKRKNGPAYLTRFSLFGFEITIGKSGDEAVAAMEALKSAIDNNENTLALEKHQYALKRGRTGNMYAVYRNYGS